MRIIIFSTLLTSPIVCALATEDDETLCSVARYFMKEFQFVTDSYRLFSILNRLCNRQNVWYNNGPTQKYILRQIKAVDFSLMEDERRKSFHEEKASYSTKDERGNPISAKEMDIALLMAYGYILFTGGSHTFALSKTVLISTIAYPFNVRTRLALTKRS